MSDDFAIFNETILADDVRLMSWCPTADLVLVVSNEDAISLYRSYPEVTKMWSLRTNTRSIIRIVTWDPNGKEVVIGYEDGIVNKVNVVCHSPKLVQCWTAKSDDSLAPITSLVWINYDYKKKQNNTEGLDTKLFDLESALPELSQDIPEEPMSMMPMPKKKKRQLLEPVQSVEKPTLLFIGNAKGQIHIILNGIYPIGSINIYEDSLDPIVLNISMPENMSSLQVLTKSGKQEDDFTLHIIDTTIFVSKKEQILTISELQTELNYLLEYTTMNLDLLKRYHTSYSKLTSKVATVASDFMEQNNDLTNAMPEVELTGTLAIGSVTESLRPFFEEYLTTQRIKQLETDVTHGYKNSIKVICEHILPGCERIQLKLSKILGYSLWTQRYGDFLETGSVQNSIDNIATLVSRIQEFAKDLNYLATTFQAFIKWITIITKKVSDTASVEDQNETSLCESPELVLEFLNKDFIKDSLSEYFVSQTPKKAYTKNLISLLVKTKESCHKMLEKPSETLSKKITVTSKVFFVLNGIILDKQPRAKIISVITPKQSFYAFLQFNPDPKLIVLKKVFSRDSVFQYSLFSISGGTITDIEFFDGEELGICLQTDQNNSILSTLLMDKMNFRTLATTKLVTEGLKVARSHVLDRVVNVKLGCNGQPRRRIFSVIGSNGLLRVLDMEPQDEE